jgi:extracellular elastinolytic metalloproteinase
MVRTESPYEMIAPPFALTLRSLSATSVPSLALVGLLGFAFAHERPVSHRKTMGFGPVYPHAKFHSNVHADIPAGFHTSPISAKAPFLNSNPYAVAKSFVTALLEGQLSGNYSFFLRKDSYSDKATGVTHVFLRQTINGNCMGKEELSR